MSKPKIETELFAGDWHAKLSIGNQSFLLRPLRTGEGSRKDAEWQAEMLRSAFGVPRLESIKVPSIHLPDPTPHA